MAAQAGLNLFSMAAGVIVDDFENDGLLDVVTSSFDMCEPMHFFHNNGDGTFTDRTAQAGLADQLGGLNMIQTDYNNDGCMDILVLRGGWEIAAAQIAACATTATAPSPMSRKETGLAEPTSTQTAVWADIDNDGFLDLFVGNENGPSQLFLNKATERSRTSRMPPASTVTAFTKAVVAADYDNDGYVDFYVSNYSGDNFLYHNNHDGTFTEVAKQAGVPGVGHGFPAWFFDYDNDGWPDLFVTSYYMSVDETVAHLSRAAAQRRDDEALPEPGQRHLPRRDRGSRARQGLHADGGELRRRRQRRLSSTSISARAILRTASLLPNVLLRNKEGKSFVDVTASSGTGELHKGHGVAFADIDNDGDEDIVTVIGGATPGDSHAFRLFENPGNGNDWISVRLVGVKANRAAIGARIKVTVKNEGREPRSIYRTVGSGGSFGASPLEQHIGLGKSAQIVSLEIWWPGNAASAAAFHQRGQESGDRNQGRLRGIPKAGAPAVRLGGPNAR